MRFWQLLLGWDNEFDVDAAAGSRRNDRVIFGSMGFMVDAGCGIHLMAERFIRSASAMDQIKGFSPSVALEVPAGTSVQLAWHVVNQHK
eukprot:7520814-Pyramimonas_sp.AAC.1